MKRSQPSVLPFRTTLHNFAANSPLALSLLLGTPMALVASPVWAQAAPVKPMNDEQKRIDFVEKRLAPQVAKNFAEAKALVPAFLAENPTLDHWQRILVFSGSGSALYFNTPEKQRAQIADEALEVLNEGLREVEASPNPNEYTRSRDVKELSHQKMRILVAEKRTAEAAKVLDQCWPLMLGSTDNSSDWCKHWREVRNLQGQPQQAVDGLIKAFEQRVSWREMFPQSITVHIVDELMTQGRDDEALSWAKLQFMMCPFEAGAIKDATRDVTRALSDRDLSVAKANLFATAQSDTAASNPLDGVKLPQYDTKAVRAQLADPAAKLSPPVRLISLLTMGDYRGAMLQARSQLVTDVGNEDSARQVARVFKAKDGDIARANQFLNFYQTGEGENPVTDFLKETEAAVTTPATP